MKSPPLPIFLCSRFSRLLLSTACAGLLIFASDVSAHGPDSLNRSLNALTASLPQSAQAALKDIPDAKRRMLAARSYAKAGAELDDRWSWSKAQTHAFESSPEYQRMQSAVAAVTREFEKQNPGYSLYTNTQVRTLDLQLERWNSNRGVQMTADDLFNSLSAKLQRRSIISADELRAMLVSWQPSTAAPLAAPGLSAHGQLRALDFQVVRGSEIVAGTSVASVASVWQREGWENRLHRAIISISANFEGPLLSPNEPWHYRYDP